MRDIIIILIAIGISAISSMMKAKNKNSASKKLEHPTPATTTLPWDFGMDRNDKKNDLDQIPEQELEEYPNETALGNYMSLEGESLEVMTPEIIQTDSEKYVLSDLSSSINSQIDTQPSFESNKNDIDDIIEEFDLRAAVIYSEILQPKYKAY